MLPPPQNPLPGPGPNADPTRFDREVAGLVSRAGPGPHRVILIGSSTFTMWATVDADLGGLDAVNHGFGGSQLSDCLHWADHLVFNFSPQAVVLYAGDNDLANGKDFDRIVRDYETFAALTFAHNPDTLLYWVSIKPSLARWTLFDEQSRINDYVQATGDQDARRRFLDIRPVMLGADGLPHANFFLGDGLHLNAHAYEAWTTVLRPRLRADLLGE